MTEYKNYTIELSERLLRGCIMSRSFPYVVRKIGSPQIVQYAKTETGAKNWIDKQQ